MDEITEYLAFLPAHAPSTGKHRADVPAASPGLPGKASTCDGEHAPFETARDLLANPKVLAALLRLARN